VQEERRIGVVSTSVPVKWTTLSFSTAARRVGLADDFPSIFALSLFQLVIARDEAIFRTMASVPGTASISFPGVRKLQTAGRPEESQCGKPAARKPACKTS